MLRIIKSVILVAGVLFATSAQAAWPERPVTLVVPFAAGGITDVLARLTAERLQTTFKQPFLIENQPGGAGVIAADRIAKAQPDGYALLFTPIFQITMAPFTHNVTFDPIKDFKPIAAIASSPFVITVGGTFPGNTLADFVAYVKSKPREITFGSAGTGSLTHICSVVFLKSTKLEMIHVPYRGVGPAFTDLLAGHIAMLAATPVELKPYLESGKVKPLAVSAAMRSKQLPNVPTIAETFASPPVVTYNGLFAPARTPDEIVQAMSREIIIAEKSPEFQEKLIRVGAEPLVTTPEEFAKIFADDMDRWRDIVRDLGLKPQ
jgi:tripartite-type tricarboxylate transporter receptor subunit TctC